MTGLKIFARLCAEAVEECGPGADIATIEKAMLKRIDVLPPVERAAVEAEVESLAAYKAPGFHEHGSH